MQRTVMPMLAAAAVFSAGIAYAAQQGAPSKLFRLKEATQVPEVSWKVATRGENSIVGNPVVSGATLNVQVTPGVTQCFQLPFADWDATNPNKFKFDNGMTISDPWILAHIRQNPDSGTFKLDVRVRGASNTIVQGDPTTNYAVNFKIGGGDEYCATLGNGVIKANDANMYKVRRDDGVTCDIPACSPSGAFLDASAGVF